MKRNIITIGIFTAIFFLASQVFANPFTDVPRRKQKEKNIVSSSRKTLEKVDELFLIGDYKAIVDICEDAQYVSQKKYLDKIYYYAGISYLKLNNFTMAKIYLNRVIAKYNQSPLLSDAYVALAEVHFLDEDYDKAKELLLNYVRTYPTGSSIPQAYFRLGRIAQKSGRWHEAKFYFNKIEKDFPLSFEAKLIPSVFNEADMFFTIQLGSFKKLENARKLKRKLEKRGYAPYIVEVKSSKSTLYRVRAGKLKSKTEAMHLADRLEEDGFEARIYP